MPDFAAAVRVFCPHRSAGQPSRYESPVPSAIAAALSRQAASFLATLGYPGVGPIDWTARSSRSCHPP
eukprot:6264556-Amphidinium_carterae.1